MRLDELEQFDGAPADRLLIQGGTIFDGLGGEGVEADLLIRNDRIEALLPPASIPGASDTRRLDAAGLALSPGFIDPHSHSDLILVLPPEPRRTLQRGKLLQGITTEICGNCGLGAAPLTLTDRDAMQAVLSWMTPAGVEWAWDSFPGYLESVGGSNLPMNAGFLAAHGAIRGAVLGLGAARADRIATQRIQGLVVEALEAGAFGLSTGLIYPPGLYADTDELVAAALPVGRAGAVFTCHIRGSSETLIPAVRELLDVGRLAGCRVHHSHTEAVGPEHWEKVDTVLEMEEASRKTGSVVTSDLFPYHAAATMMVAIYPPWALEGGPAALLDRLKAPSERARIRHDVESLVPSWPPWCAGGWPHNLVRACGYERIFVARTGGKTRGRYDGLSLRELGKARGIEPFEAISDLMIEEEAQVGQWIFGITGEASDDRPMVKLLASPHCAIATDACDYGTGLPHPAAYGAFARILAHYVRERRLLRLGEAIRRMTSLPAAALGLSDRGRLAPGCFADIVLFDPLIVGDRASFTEPRREAIGVQLVLVNGRPAVRGGELTGIDAGRLLRRAN